MSDLDYQLVKRLQAEVGRRRQSAIEQRRSTGAEPLTGEDARQHDRALVQRVVTDHETSLVEAGLEPLAWSGRQDIIDALEARLFGAGSLQQLLDDESVENIDINGYRNIFVSYADGSRLRMRPVVGSNEELIETIQTLAAHEGLSARAFDASNVRVNLRLHDGSRLYAVQAVAREPVVSIRKHRHVRVKLKDLVANGTLDDDLADFLAAAVRANKNLMVAGATNAGKTTLLRALAAEIPASERLITVERSLELGLDEDSEAHPDAIAFEERLPNTEGVGAVTMAELVRDTLRLHPDRVIVGEVLGDEVITMLNAMTQGNDGSLSTIHANSSESVIDKIVTYAMQAPERLHPEATVRLVASGLDFVVFIRREAGRRYLESVREVAGITESGGLATNELWGPDGSGNVVRRHAVQVICSSDLIEAGWQPGTRQGWA